MIYFYFTKATMVWDIKIKCLRYTKNAFNQNLFG